ncbi:hypothetical protein FEM03_12885 [Phragmitibacter flavus]|uniref:Lipoprotein n=1 Tax=Phragmitibacter flavus TaxID=2576071 RepID=A0A5R8KF39_9BACT|nr:hypothetical protein [Phragmitibacter flavus]TLD70605.1 hypothetical protein FEM03_12885 [Phragmitibacter flavus]
MISATFPVLRLAAAAAFAALLSSCGSTSTITLDYQPTGQTITGPRKVAVGRFIDHRRVGSYHLGAVRTPIGTTMEELTTRVPVEQVVRNAFAHGLSSRRMLTEQNGAQFILTGEILEFAADQLVRPGAYAKVRVNLVREGSGQIIFSRVYTGERAGSAYLPGSGSPVPALQEMASRALQDTVDKALDDPSLRSRLSSFDGGRIRANEPYGPNVL